MRPRIGVLGASGCGNVGDDLIADVLVRSLKNSLAGYVDVFLIPNPYSREHITNIDVLVIGGGGLIYDYDAENVDNYCNAIHLANNFRIPVYMMGMGVQHVFSEEARDKYRDALPIVKAIATRGTEDSKVIRDLGYKGRLIESRDLVFLYDDVYTPLDVSGDLGSIEKRQKIVLSLSDWRLGDNYAKIKNNLGKDYDSYSNYVVENIGTLSDKYNIEIVCQAAEDEEVSSLIASKVSGNVVRYDGVDEARYLVERFRSADLVVTNRYHGLIAACVAKTPVVAVSFSSHKSERLISDSIDSLKDQYYTIDKFVKNDVINLLMSDEYFNNIKPISDKNKRRCIGLARKNGKIIQMIASDIERLYGGIYE